LPSTDGLPSGQVIVSQTISTSQLEISLNRRTRILLFLLSFLSSSLLFAQIDRTELNGSVTDESGGSLAAVSITVTQEGTNQIRIVTTDSHGQYVVSSLPIGRFSIVFAHDGFTDLRVADLDLHSGDIRTINAKLAVGSINQTVAVEGDLGGAQLDKSNATFGGTIQSVQVSELPLNGRNITNLELLAPGAIDSGSGAQSSIRFAGNGTDDNNFRLDGVDASGVFHASLKSALRLQFSTEAIAEFKVDSGAYTADTGGSAGGQVSLISKTGTNAFHGSVFDYLRNNYFDAQGPIKSAAKRPVFQLNQFGGSLGGPIIKNRTFFFANYEGFRQQLGGSSTNRFRAKSGVSRTGGRCAAQPRLHRQRVSARTGSYVRPEGLFFHRCSSESESRECRYRSSRPPLLLT
jgi:hypothetical protein